MEATQARTRPRADSRLLLTLVLASAASGCSKGTAEAPAPERVSWAAVGESQNARQVRVSQRIPLPAAPEEWDIEGMPARVFGDAKFLRMRAKEPPEQVRIGIEGEFDPRTFNRVVVRASSLEDVQVSAVFSENGEFRATTAAQRNIPGRKQAREAAPEAVNLVVRQPADAAGTYTRLVLIFQGATQLLDLHSIDLLFEPRLSELPAPEQPALVAIGNEQRRAVGLSAAAPLALELDSLAGRELRFACGIPQPQRVPVGGRRAPAPVLEVEVTGDNGETKQHTVELDNDRDANFEWIEVRLPLQPFGSGARVEARLRESPDGRERVCAVSEPELAPVSAANAPSEAPTVILITSDTHRADHVGAAGLGIEIRTPTLDALAQRGVYFDNCFSTTNVTVPSHVAIMTSRASRDSGIVDNTSRLSDAAVTLAELFRDEGWTTYASISARTMGAVELGVGQGFERMGAPNRPTRPAGDTIAQLEEWLPDADGKPLFVWLHVFDAHAPYEPPGEFDRMYYDKQRDPFGAELPDPGLPEGILLPWIEGLRDLEFPSAQYRAEISYLDSELGRLLERPRFRNAIVAMTADHGETLGTNDIYWDHAELYPSNLHVPLILAWPEAPRGTRVDKAVFNSQLGRTLLDLARLEHVPFGGENLLASLEPDYADDRPRFVLSANCSSASLTYDGWHLILHLRRHWHGITQALEPIPKHALELYDLVADPQCEENRAQSEHERARAMRARLIQWLGEAEDSGWVDGASQDAQILAELAQLGYVTSTPAFGEEGFFDTECDCENCAPFE